ncbi:MAG: LUD domain-containing protein, partial [Sulfurovum sp.]|nr:LUD domain-containing protein [Sulfurovum sp.]
MQTTIDNLRNNGFEVIEVATKEEAFELAKGFVESGMKVGLGGSTTVSDIGLLEWLTQKSDIELCNQYEQGISMEDNVERRRQGLVSDLYITSSNAITRNGDLVNADGDGNRVAAQIFGPKKVLLIVSKNKIVDNIQDGFGRIRGLVVPKNIERMNAKAISMGKEPRYNDGNIANKFVFINGDKEGR